MRSLTGMLLAGVLILAGSCGGDSTSPGSTAGACSSTTGAGGNTVTVCDDFFAPASITVSRGTTVTWTWSNTIQHNVTFSDGTASPTQTNGTFSRTFNTAGTFNYVCTIHAPAMAGTVIVQ